MVVLSHNSNSFLFKSIKVIIANFTACAGTHFRRIWAEVHIARTYRFAKTGLVDTKGSVHVQRVYTVYLSIGSFT